MPRFVFRLAPVLHQRERVEEQKKQFLAREQRVLADAQARREMLRGRREALARELIFEHRKLDIEGLRLAYAHLDFLAREITAADWHVAACEQAVDRAREVLVRATKDRKILDRLQERQREAFRTEQLRVEQRELDDDNARRYHRATQSAH
jgi:flagellar FliJ protein